MPRELILTNARLILPDSVISGTVKIEGGSIQELDLGRAVFPKGLDLEGDFLLPGLIETHTDNFEKHLLPRPGVLWPAPLSGVLAHDRQIIAAGITTVFDSLFLGEYVDGSLRRKLVYRMVEANRAARKEGLLLADHRLHLRCEVPDESAWELLQELGQDPMVGLVSLNDHTPYQRQWTRIEAFKTYHSDKKWSDRDFEILVAEKLDRQERTAPVNRIRISRYCRERGIPLATHDDTLPEHVDQAVSEGAAITEFPTTLEAARKARAAGLMIVAGAPNLVRGSSHSSNVSARLLAENGLLDVLSSDYVPNGLIHAAFVLHQELGLDLASAVACVTTNPAKMVGLEDRGALLPGHLADLVRVRLVGDLPVVTGVWRAGEKVV